MSKPPIFSMPLTGTQAQQYLHRARQFRQAAIGMPDYLNAEQNWPKYALVTHAIELALKAFAQQSVESGKPALPQPKQHDLNGWYQMALQYGLSHNAAMEENIGLLNELHQNHYTRYPPSRTKPLPSADNIADDVVDMLIAEFTKSINPARR